MPQPITNPPVPFAGPITEGLAPGLIIRIQGQVLPTADRFNVNLLCGPPPSDIAMHISVRFLQNYVARNSLVGGSWGNEEDTGTLTIAPGQSFEILVLCDPASYKIAVNGNHFAEFRHRVPFQEVSHLAIDGDISLRLIAFEGNASAPPPSGPPMTGEPEFGYSTPPGAYGPSPQYGYGPGGPPPQYGYGSGGPPRPQPMPMPTPTNINQPPAFGMPVPTSAHLPPSNMPMPTSGSVLFPSMNIQPSYPTSTYAPGYQTWNQRNSTNSNCPTLGYPASNYTYPSLGCSNIGYATSYPNQKVKKSKLKKAMKYGLPIAGAGLGAYALSQAFHHGLSNSSGSSDSD